MKPLLAFAASLLLAYAVRGESYTVRVRETAIVEIGGATAAWTTNPAIADATLAGAGNVSVTGHSSGTTQLVVLIGSGTQSFLITVAASAQATAATRPEAGVPQVRYEGRYSSSSARVQNTIDVVKDADAFHILHVHDRSAQPGQSSDTIASIFYRHTTPRRTWTLLDEMVDVSRMTISGTQIRGAHLRQGPLELHGGYASTAIYDGFFLPAERRWVGGAGYHIDHRSIRWTPSVYGFFSAPAGTAARRGLVGALTAEHREGDTLFVRGEVGVSRSLAAAGEIQHRSSRTQFRAFFSLKPDDFPSLGLADIRGTHGELDWTRRATDRFSITSHATFDRFNLAALPQTIASSSAGLRYGLTPRLVVHGGADVSEVRTPATSIRTIGVPLGVTYDAPAFGLAASYRMLDHSAASRRGDALRLSGRAGSGRFNATAWAERQRQAPTLDLIFRAEPGLELALLRLGITVRTPEDVARALRDNAALIDLGFITGVNVDLTPRRLQAGFNAGWLGSGPRSNHFRLLAVYGRDEGISSTRDSMIATLTWSRRILAATDLFGSYSWWRTTLGALPETGTSVDVGLRQQFTGIPRFLQRSGTIEGFVFLDPEIRGVRGEGTAPLADIAVTLDETRTAQTDARGAYTFDRVPPGTHRVAAHLPASPHAFFTTPSHSVTKVPARVDFGVVWAAARIDGRVISDAGVGMRGVVVSATAENGAPISATSDAEGRFVFAVPGGTFRIGLAAESLPAGYSVDAQHQRSVAVEPDQPQSISLQVRALRSVAGRAAGATEVLIEALNRIAPVDAEGNFLFRSMPSGTFTLSARGGGRIVDRTVTLPAEPSMLRNIVLGAAEAVEHALPIVTRKAGANRPHVVQAGAFREQRNAAQLLGRLQRRGEQPFSVATPRLTLVYVGPFATRQQAVAASERMRRAGFDGFVTRR